MEGCIVNPTPLVVSLSLLRVYSVCVVWCACCNRGHNAAETERRLKRG